MVTHHKFIAGERIQGVLELPGLRHGKIPALSIRRTGAAGPLPARLGEESKGLGETSGNGADRSAWNMPSRSASVFLDPSIAPNWSRSPSVSRLSTPTPAGGCEDFIHRARGRGCCCTHH